MPRRHKVRKFKPYLMRYLHSDDPNYEPVLMDLLEHQHLIYDESTVGEGAESTRGERLPHMWHVVFTELTDILTPFHIEQLFERLEKDFSATCRILREMSDPQPVEKEPDFKHYLMRYLNSNDPNYEPVLRDILEHEHEIYDAITASEEVDFRRGERGTLTWQAVHGQLSKVVSPEQIRELFDKLERDFSATCKLFHEMAEAEKLIQEEEGGPG